MFKGDHMKKAFLVFIQLRSHKKVLLRLSATFPGFKIVIVRSFFLRRIPGADQRPISA
jgi:hypothetical protein